MRTHIVASALAIGAIAFPFTSAMSAQDAASKSRACTPQWELEPVPQSVGGDARADTVSAISKRDVRVYGTTPFVGPWSMQWDGRSVVETPMAPLGPGRTTSSGSVAQGASYASADEGWLPLNVNSRYTGGIPTAAHWQDGQWTLTPTAVPPNAEPGTRLMLSSVTSLASDNAWAVGYVRDLAAGEDADTTLIEHWDGSQWRVVDHPTATRPATLRDIDAVRPTDVWAVGSTDARPLVMHYDGTEWTVAPTPAIPPGQLPANLRATSVTEDGHVWAVGIQEIHLTPSGWYGKPLVLHYDGSGWQRLPDPGIGDSVRLVGVYAAADDDVWAVANRADHAPSDLLHWDGETWTTVEWPGPKQLGLRYYATDIDGTGPDDVWVTGYVQELGSGSGLVPVTLTPQIAHLSCGRGK